MMGAAFSQGVHAMIRNRMRARGWKQRHLAAAMDLTEARVSQMMTNANLTIRTVDKILNAIEGAPQ